MADGREVELKLELPEGQGDTLHAHPLLAGVAGVQKAQTTIYYDTPKGALTKSGYTLRLRTVGDRHVQTIKQTAGGSAGLFDRPEWEEDVAGPHIDFAALDRTPLGVVLGKKARHKLEAVITSTVNRTIWLVPYQGSEIELSLDEGTVSAAGAEQRLAELELELKQGEPATILAFARELGRTTELRIGVLTKAERGVSLANGTAGRVAKAEPLSIAPAMDVREAFAAIIHACLKHFRLNEPLVVARQDPKALHQARVAMRRLRSAFSLFGTAVEDEEMARLREELRWFTAQLGDARNLDVLIERFEDAPLSPENRASLDAARARAYDIVLAALQSQRLRDLILDLVGWVEFGQWRGNAEARAPIAHFAVARLDKRWRKIKKAGRDLQALEEEPRHRVRIEIKKLRYAIEFLSALFGPKKQKTFLAAMATMQEELGSLNDFATAREVLAQIPGLDPQSIPAPTAAEEQKHLANAQQAYAEAAAVGPFWRKAAA